MHPTRLTSLCALCLLLLAPLVAGAEEPPRPLRFPDIHDDFVVFAYAGDIWRAPADGGAARRLTAHEGLEVFPRISPDGEWVAFSGEYSGTRQVYVMPAEGGTPRQLTFYADVGVMAPRGGWDYWIQGWTPDGKILVRCNRTPWGRRMGRYCVVDPAGGLETYLPLPEGGSAALSPDGKKLAYTPIQREFRTWKRHLGGRAQDVWIYDLEAEKSERVTTHPGTDNQPMWSGDTIYFTSDRDDTLELFAWKPGMSEPRQLTRDDTWDVLWPNLGPKAIVFQKGGYLWRFDLTSEESRRIDIAITTDLPVAVPHFRDVSGNIQNASISPSAKRAVFEARGELFTVPKEHGVIRRLTHTEGVRETDPAWSPDGRWIAYFSDATGEYDLYLRAPGLGGETRQVTQGGDVWLSTPLWSPDSKYVAWNDTDRRLRYVEVESGNVVDVATGELGNLGNYSWSPDSRWIAYQSWHPNRLPAIAVHSLAEGTSTVLGDGLTSDRAPVWSHDGKYLFFLSDREYNLRFSGFEFDHVHDRATRIYAAALDPDAAPLFPWKSDEEEVQDDEDKNDEDKDEGEDKTKKGGKKGDKGGAKDDAEPEEEKASLRVVAEGFVERTIALPGISGGNYVGLTATEKAVFYARVGNGPPALVRYDLDKRAEETLLEGIQNYDLTPDGSKLLYQARGTWGIADAGGAIKPDTGKLDLSAMSIKIDLRVEWQQMYRDAWRITRDFFYDENMHGYDWDALGERYGKLVPQVGHRSELDFILGELMSELEAGHTYVQAGDEPRVDRVAGGKLGCELELDADSGRFRVARIFRGENWDDAYRSPLTEPGVNVKVGDYLLSVDGESLAHPDNPYRLLEGKAERQVVLKVASSPDGEVREVTVRPLADEGNVRYIDWIKSRMEITERLSGGKVGYIHLPDTAVSGNRMLQKLFYSQVAKPALIIDERYNGGGFIPNRMIEYLERKPMSYWSRRDIKPNPTPGFAHAGPKAMLINGYSSSGGDALPFYFKQAGLGKLIGTRTWGGLIGISGAPPLVDGGVVLPPTFRVFDVEGNWVVENEGVPPDIEVFDLPEARMKGGDPSIETAVEVLLEELEQNPVSEPKMPAPPDMTKN